MTTIICENESQYRFAFDLADHDARVTMGAKVGLESPEGVPVTSELPSSSVRMKEGE